jgi:hypothetical protein
MFVTINIRPGQGRSAVELIDGVAIPRNGSSTGHDGKELPQELAQKDPSLSSTQPPLEKEIQETVIKHQKILQRHPANERHHPPPSPQPKHDPTKERGMSRDF